MSALVLPFINTNSRSSVKKSVFKSKEVLNVNSVRKEKLENLLFEIKLIKQIKNGFIDSETFLYEKNLLDSEIESDEELFLEKEEDLFSSVVGVFEGYYGSLILDLSCTGKGYIDFCYCFKNPDLEKCKLDFPEEHFKLSFPGVETTSMKQFENYLQLFTMSGEIYRGFDSKKRGQLKNLRNPHQSENFKGYNIKIVEPMLRYSLVEYFKKFKISC